MQTSALFPPHWEVSATSSYTRTIDGLSNYRKRRARTRSNAKQAKRIGEKECDFGKKADDKRINKVMHHHSEIKLKSPLARFVLWDFFFLRFPSFGLDFFPYASKSLSLIPTLPLRTIPYNRMI